MTHTNPFLNASRAAFAELTTAEAQAWYRLKFNEFSAFLGNVRQRGISTATRLVKFNSETTPLVPVVVEKPAVEDVLPVLEPLETIANVEFAPGMDSIGDSVNNGLENTETSADLDLGLDPSDDEQQEIPIYQSVESAVEEAEDPEASNTEEISAVDVLDDEPTELADDEDSEESEAEFLGSRARKQRYT